MARPLTFLPGVVAALSAVIALSWAYLLVDTGIAMSAMETTGMPPLGTAVRALDGDMAVMAMLAPAVWTPAYAAAMFFTWCVMMVATMLPGAAPMILLYARVNRTHGDAGHGFVATGVFALGYLAAWAGFSACAVIVQWWLQRSGMLSPMLVATNVIFGSFLLLAAGAYQLSPIKHGCLRRCRSPLAFLATHWRRGFRGAFRMGLAHGAYCVGCCWMLMGLMFFGGVMNLYWIAGLTVLVLLEKTVPAGHWLGYATGVALVVWGTAMLVAAL